MTELEISIGGRIFSVACETEEEEKVKRAAALINEEADSIQTQLGRLPEAKMLLLSALMIADRLVDVESDSKIFQERSEDFSNIKNKNEELERQKNALQNDYQKLEKFVEKMLGKLETVSDLSINKSDALLDDENSTKKVDTDQPKLF
ncbi:MAG: cell division protein ZapA [Paracoccaceae bacterium]|nr:MAG: cell division protein ZapA [Alphaproteobacteria bacterium]|tara:strand:+ start:610 stop:1053 length:444 start_codon:yes stop_codon:yes gene_type:complete